MSLRKWAFAGLTAFLALTVGSCWVLFERVEVVRETGLSARAQANPWLAAQRLLDRLGLEATSVRGPMRLPPHDFALVLLTPRRSVGVERSRQLLDWVAAGGRLIVTPRRDRELPDPLLEELRVGLELRPQEAAGEDPVSDEDPEGSEARREVVRLRSHPGARPHAVAVDAGIRLALDAAALDSPSPPFIDATGRLARFAHGGGQITVLADAAFLGNGEIGEHQHASFFWSLLTEPVPPAGVWLVYRDRMPPLMQLVAQRGWPALVAAACWLIAWLWHHVPRFGPLAEAASPERRRLAEHLEASAELLWREGEGEALLDAERQALWRAAERAHPGWSTLPESERLARLAGLAGLSSGQLHRALTAPFDPDPNAFTRMVAILEKVRRSL